MCTARNDGVFGTDAKEEVDSRPWYCIALSFYRKSTWSCGFFTLGVSDKCRCVVGAIGRCEADRVYCGQSLFFHA